MILSNSDIKDFQTCEMKFVFSRSMQLQGKVLPQPLRTGIFGHAILHRFFLVIQEKGLGALEDAIDAASNHELIMELIADGDIETIKVLRQDLAFGTYAVQKGWMPVSLEEPRIYPSTVPSVDFAYTPDGIFEHTQGPLSGNEFVLDYKHLAQYWDDAVVSVWQQGPKYARYLNKNEGRRIKQVGVVMLNTRPTKNDTSLFLVKWVPLTPQKLARIEEENERLLKEVSQLSLLPLKDQLEVANRTVNEYTCKMCMFRNDVCPQSLLGRDISGALRHNYVKNTYGYEENPNEAELSMLKNGDSDL